MNELFRNLPPPDPNNRGGAEPGRPVRKRAIRRPRKAEAPLALLADGTERRATGLQGTLLAALAPASGQQILALPPPENFRRQTWRPGIFGVLDIGTSKITCLIGRGDQDGGLRIMGCGWQRSRGIRLGGITDLKEAERAIRAAVGQAETAADYHLRSVTVALTCGQPESRLFNVRWPVGGRIVGDADIRRIINEGRVRAASEGRDVVHAIPLNFSIDEVDGVEDPRGHHCDQLSARLHVIDATSMALRNLSSVITRCDLSVTEMVAAPFASGLSSLVDDERELGATVIDMGGGTTQIAVFAENQLIHTSQIPLGGLHVTRDIAEILSTPLSSAERLKVMHGNTEITAEDEREILQVQQIGEDDHRFSRLPRSRVVEVIRPRLEEIFELVHDRMEHAGLGRAGTGRVVLTGGASQLDGVQRLAARVLNRQVRLGRPIGMQGLQLDAAGPGFSTATGLLAWAAGAGRNLADIDLAEPRPSGLIRRLIEFLRERV